MTDARNDLPSTNSNNFEQRVRETLMTYMGRQGNPMDRGITMRDLLQSGIGTLQDGSLISKGGGVGGSGDAGGGGSTYVPDLTPAPTPAGFKVLAGNNNIFIEHDDPVFTAGHGYLRTAVYGKIKGEGEPNPVFADAVKISEFSG